MKKVLSIILSLLLVMVMVTSCSSKPQESQPTNQESNENSKNESGEKPADLEWDGYEQSKGLEGTITYMHWGDDYERQMYANLIEEYERLVPGVKVEQMFTPSDYYTKLKTLVASKTVPDVFWLSESNVREYADAGILTDLGETLSKYPTMTKGMFDGVLEYGQLDGVQYCIPKDFSSYVMYINVDMFEEAGLEIPTSDWTMDEYIDIAKKLTKVENGRTVQFGTCVNSYRADWINFMGNFDGQWFKNGKSNFSDANAIKGLNVQASLINNGCAPAPGTTGDSEDRMFIIGQVAMYPSGRWVVPSFKEECDFEWTAVEFPKGTTRVCPFITSNLGLSSSTQNKEIAENFLSFYMSKTGQGYTLTSGLACPVFKDLITDKKYFSEPVDAFIATTEYIGDKEQIDAISTGKFSKYSSIMSAELSLVYEGSQTVEEAAANIDKQANETLFNN